MRAGYALFDVGAREFVSETGLGGGDLHESFAAAENARDGLDGDRDVAIVRTKIIPPSDA